MAVRPGGIAATLALFGLCAGPALGSSGPDPSPVYIDRGGGTPAELARLYAGRLAVVTPASRDALLYLDWRLLHGLDVGPAAGAALSKPCCNEVSDDGTTGVYGWLEARKRVPGVPESPYYLTTERSGPDYTSIPNCFSDAFDTATATLRERGERFGWSSPALRAWLLTQDAVFDACANPEAALPALAADSPAWLRADRAYQEAAFALYNQRNLEASRLFAAIARDPASPWQPRGLYLQARALHREALAVRSSEAFAKAEAAIAGLAAAPAGTYGQGEVRKMLGALRYREHPAELLAELDRELNRRAANADIAVRLRDYLSLSETAPARPEAADWIVTVQTRGVERESALAHARERWSATRDEAWLVAALALAGPDDAGADALAADAARVEPGRPAWITAQYHLFRLTLARADPAAARSKLDSILARADLTRTERNLFSGLRMQVAAGLSDLARFALREPFCSAANSYCVEGGWAQLDGTLGRRSDGLWVGLGADARAVIDRLPLAERIALSRDRTLPAPIRLDIALTGFARAVKLQDEAAIDGLARDLAGLLPQMRGEWRAVGAAKPGPAKRFAEYFAMAKIPGLRPDLIDYTRPEGTVRQFRGYWVDWMIPPPGRPAGEAGFARGSAYRWDGWWSDHEAVADLTCLDKCGAGPFPLHLPAFVSTREPQARAERTAFAFDRTGDPAWPEGARSLWEEMFDYARAHPSDPRSPEALYWLIHIARWGANPDHIGKRAFQLLHARHPGSAWTKRSPFYYDD